MKFVKAILIWLLMATALTVIVFMEETDEG